MVSPKHSLPHGVSWVPGTFDSGPLSAVAGTDPVSGNPLHVARASAQHSTNGDNVQVGVASVESESLIAELPFYGGSQSCEEFDVLVLSEEVNYRWVSARDGIVPRGAISSGLDERRQTIFVARVQVGDYMMPAKLLPRFYGAFSAFESKEYFRKRYEVLCVYEDEEEMEDEQVEDKCEGEEEEQGLDDERVDEVRTPEGLAWKFASDGESFEKAVTADDDNRMVVVRGSDKDALGCGVLVQNTATAEIPHARLAAKHSRYEVLVNEGGVGLEWVRAHEGHIPPRAVQGGMTEEDERLFIVRAKLDGELICGMASSSSHAARVGYNGREYVRKVFDVLCVEETGDDGDEEAEEDDDPRKVEVEVFEGLEWVDSKDGQIPDNAVVFELGSDQSTSSRMFVARGSLPRELLPGGVALGETCTVPYFSKVVDIERYDVLTNPSGMRLGWVHAKGGEFPPGAIQGGVSNKGDRIFVARGTPKKMNSYRVGKFRAGFKVAFVAGVMREESVFKYDVLCKLGPEHDKWGLDEVVCGFEEVPEQVAETEVQDNQATRETSFSEEDDTEEEEDRIVKRGSVAIDVSPSMDEGDERSPLLNESRAVRTVQKGWLVFRGDFYHGVDYWWWALVTIVAMFAGTFGWYFVFDM